MLERAEAERRQKQEIQENKIRRVQLKESCEFFGGKNDLKSSPKHFLLYFRPKKFVDYQKHINEIDVTIEKEKEVKFKMKTEIDYSQAAF